MAHFAKSLTSLASIASVVALAASGLACGGSDTSMQPQTPASATSTTSATGLGAKDPSASAPPPTTSGDTAAESTASGLDSNAARSTPPSGAPRNGALTTSGSPMDSQPSLMPPQQTWSAPVQGTTSAGSTLSDAQIAAVTDAANTGEIAQARVAMTKAKSPKVKAFAQHMVTDHQAAETQQMAIAKKGHFIPEENDVSRELQANGGQVMASLKSSTGASFDQSYMEAQVSEHTRVLQLLDDKLVPQAQNAALKSHLQAVRTKVAAHLQMAKDIQATLQ